MSERSTSGAPRARLVPGRGIGRSAAELAGDVPLTVGRLADCGLRLDDPSLSRRHATLWFAEDCWWVKDESSLNGTFLNGERVETAALAPGDRLDFGGQAEFTFRPAGRGEGAPADRFSPAGLFCCGLRPLDGGRTLVLRRRLTLVGRNATADLVLDDPGVSGVHARILRTGGRLSVMDSGSRNGTVVNGETVRRALVGPGDEIHFGGKGFRVTRTPVPTGGALTSGAALALVLIAAVVLPLLVRVGASSAEPLWTREMYLTQVTESLVDAVQACDRQPRAVEVARAQFAIAQRSLVAVDILRPDRLTDEDLRRALTQAAGDQRLSRELAGRDLFALYRSLDEPAAAPPPPPPAAAADPFDLEEELSRMVAQFGIDTRVRPIPPLMIQEVARCIEFWTGPKRGFTERSLVRAGAHLEMIRAELSRSRLPEIFCYLPFIESGYVTEAESGAAAKGLWQFMASTGRDYGLRIDGTVDERTDPLKSTQAACRYLESLLNMFGPDAFLCAVAAYNKGENGMARCLKENGNWRATWKFWDVVANNDGCLKPETVEYVPRFLAAAVILRRPEAFGLTGS